MKTFLNKVKDFTQRIFNKVRSLFNKELRNQQKQVKELRKLFTKLPSPVLLDTSFC